MSLCGLCQRVWLDWSSSYEEVKESFFSMWWNWSDWIGKFVQDLFLLWKRTGGAFWVITLSYSFASLPSLSQLPLSSWAKWEGGVPGVLGLSPSWFSILPSAVEILRGLHSLSVVRLGRQGKCLGRPNSLGFGARQSLLRPPFGFQILLHPLECCRKDFYIYIGCL